MGDWPSWHRELVSGARRGLLAGLERFGLSCLSLPYAGAMILRNRLYDLGLKRTHTVPAKVVSVGNLTLGGTGKTPAVEWLARFCREEDAQVAILSRGYGAGAGRNDEALVLEENLPDVPHLQAADRVALAHTAAEELESEVLILDDGFQHRRLRRDLDVVLLDSTNPWGYGHVFPRGLLREPRSGLKRADAVMLTRCDQASAEAVAALRKDAERLAPGKPILETRHAPQGLVNSDGMSLATDKLQGKPVAALCGLGNPQAFVSTVKSLGAEVVAERFFPDHHPYSKADVDGLAAWAATLPADACIVTSQKDLVKLRVARLGRTPVWAVRIALEPLGDPAPIHALLRSLLN